MEAMDSNSAPDVKKDEFREALGFKPQKETVFNSFLPYTDKLDAESNPILAEIKANLSLAVQLRDLKVGARHWIVQLERWVVGVCVETTVSSTLSSCVELIVDGMIKIIISMKWGRVIGY